MEYTTYRSRANTSTDTRPPSPPLSRRNSVAGPIMRQPAAQPLLVLGDYVPADVNALAGNSPDSVPTTAPITHQSVGRPAPLARHNTFSGWLGSWFPSRHSESDSLAHSTVSLPSPHNTAGDSDMLARRRSLVVDMTRSSPTGGAQSSSVLHSSIDIPLVGSIGGENGNPLAASATKTNPVEVPHRRLSQSLAGVSPRSSSSANSPYVNGSASIHSPFGSASETSPANPGVEGDMFWMVLRDLGE